MFTAWTCSTEMLCRHQKFGHLEILLLSQKNAIRGARKKNFCSPHSLNRHEFPHSKWPIEPPHSTSGNHTSIVYLCCTESWTPTTWTSFWAPIWCWKHGEIQFWRSDHHWTRTLWQYSWSSQLPQKGKIWNPQIEWYVVIFNSVAMLGSWSFIFNNNVCLFTSRTCQTLCSSYFVSNSSVQNSQLHGRTSPCWVQVRS